MIVEELMALPCWIDFEGVNFELQIFNDGGTELHLCYRIAYVGENSPHRAEFDAHGCWANKIVDPDDPPYQGFLMLYEGINTDVDLIFAVRSMWHWLWAHGLGSQMPKEKL